MKLGEGSVSVWFDPWLMHGSICELIPLIDIHDATAKVRDVWRDGDWHLESLYTALPLDIAQRVQQLTPYLVDGVRDVWRWNPSTDGVYSARSGYKWLLQNNHQQQHGEMSWNWLWKLPIPANAQFLLWQVCHGALPTRKILMQRGVCATNSCPLCNNQEEDVIHWIFTCRKVAHVWAYFRIMVDAPLVDIL